MRVVFDTNTVISALLFGHGQLNWLRDHWRSDDVVALVSRPTVDELIRVLAYPKFNLDKVEIEALLADYLLLPKQWRFRRDHNHRSAVT